MRIVALGTQLSVCVLASAAAPLTQEEIYREREVLDPTAEEWVVQTPPAEGTPEAELNRARLLLVQGKPKAARRILDDWIADNPDHPRYFEGVYLLGEAQFERGDYFKAYELFEEVADNTQGELFGKALRREVDVARAFLAGEPRIVWRVLRLPAYDDGIKILDRVWERAQQSRLAEDALRLKGDYFFEVGDVGLAQDEYSNLVQQYPNGRYKQYAMLRSAEAAAAAFPGIQFDDRALIDADERYRVFAETYPDYAQREAVTERRNAIREQRAQKDLDIAKWYEKTGQPSAAEFYYRTIIGEWSESLAANEARVRLLALGVRLEPEPMP